VTAEGVRDQFEEALASPEPTRALHELAQAFKAAGMGQVAMLRVFSEFQQQLDGDDPRYDAVVDTMDLIWGGPWARGHALFETEPPGDRSAGAGP
jgi:hypothetical protein